MANPIRIMQFPGTMLFGGVGSIVMDIYRKVDKSLVQFDFCVPRQYKGPLDDEIEQLGGRVFYIPEMRKVGIKKYIIEITQLLDKNGPYDAVHIHSIHIGAITLYAAKKAGVKKRIYHAHSTQDPALDNMPMHNIVEYLLKIYIRHNSTSLLACGKLAGIYIYGNRPFSVINNAVNLNRFFPYSKENSDVIKNQLKIPSNAIVVGDVARFVPEKNIEQFVALANLDKENGGNIHFLIVGDGPLMEKIVNDIKKSNCNEKFSFMGARKDVERLYNVMDVFCLPSIFEGLPVTLMEAQACGLPCVTSMNVTNEANMSITAYKRLSLEDDRQLWLDTIYSMANSKCYDKDCIRQAFSRRNYEIEKIARQVELIYLG